MTQSTGTKIAATMATKKQIREYYKKEGYTVCISKDGHVKYRQANNLSWFEGRWVSEYRMDPKHGIYLT